MPAIVRILLTGASGYLGQHLLNHLVQSPPPGDVTYKITALYNKAEHFATAAAAASSSHVQIIPKKCNLVEYDETDSYDICIHTAAISNIRACQEDPEKAEAINNPTKFLEATKNIPMIALSTDQVYDGKQTVDPNDTSSFYQEAIAKPNPLNVYAKTKLKTEETLKELRSPNVPTYVLRSSIILGPKAPISPEDAHGTFLDWVKTRQGQETNLWANEFRTVVSVKHACNVIGWMVRQNTAACSTGDEFHIFNLGGNKRVNRLDLGKAVFAHFGFEADVLKSADQTSPTVPLDISMDCSSLAKHTGIVYEPATLHGLIEFAFPKSS